MVDDVVTQRYRRMAHNNRWSNYRLLGACAAVGDEAVAAPGVSFFPSLLATLNHILIVDRYYVDAFKGGSLGVAAFANEIPCQTVASLAQAQQEIDLELIAFCDALDDERLVCPVTMHRSDRLQHEVLEDVLLHLFTHQIHHRGQAHAMLAATVVKPPQLDEFYCAMDLSLRTPDVARMLTDPF